MSSLRKYQQNSNHLLNTALSMFKSKRIKTVVVEGQCDKRFLSQWIRKDAEIRFDGLNGKPLVNDVFKGSQSKPYSDYEFLYFFADIDYDMISKIPLNNHVTFVYNAYCFNENKLHFNDLETYLINTSAFDKVLANMDIDLSEAPDIRERLKRSSRFCGSFRAADIIVQKKNGLRSSILNGLDIAAFLNPEEIAFREDELLRALPNWSNYREYTDDLIEEAQRLDRETPDGWFLSRGHDITEILALYLERRSGKPIKADRIELMLRLACEFADFQNSPMGSRLASSNGMADMYHPCTG